MLSGTSLVLGIETSCDETGAAVVEGGVRVRSNVVASQTETHAEYGGVVPELASRAHCERILPVVRSALREAGVGLADIRAVAVGHRPGLIGPLLVGVSGAKALAWSLGVPFIGVDHVRAHLYAGCLSADDVPAQAAEFPALGLVVSGGHTSIYLVESWTSVTRLGGTIDDAMGEAYDKAATILGLPYPGGPEVDRLACAPGANDRAFDLPVSRLGAGSLDFSFSGLKTAVLYSVRGVPGKRGEAAAPALDEIRRRDLAASFQRVAVKSVIVKLERAVEFLRAEKGTRCRTLLAGGGVTANSRLRVELMEFARRADLGLRLPAMRLCVDNGAMIAGLAFELWKAGEVSDLSLSAVPTVTS